MEGFRRSPEVDTTLEELNTRSRVEWMIINRRENFVKYRYVSVSGLVKDVFYRNTNEEEMKLFEVEIRKWKKEGRGGCLGMVL